MIAFVDLLSIIGSEFLHFRGNFAFLGLMMAMKPLIVVSILRFSYDFRFCFGFLADISEDSMSGAEDKKSSHAEVFVHPVSYDKKKCLCCL